MPLRQYQSDAVAAIYRHMRQSPGSHPLAVLPTGSGKTWIAAQVASDVALKWGGRCHYITHSSELVQQTLDKIRMHSPDCPVGVYSAKLGGRDGTKPVTLATIDSVYTDVNRIGPCNICIIDECQLVPEMGSGKFRTLIDGLIELNPKTRIVGLSATPYRLSGGMVYGKDRVFDSVCYEIGINDLVRGGHLCKIKLRGSSHAVDTDTLRTKAGEFAPASMFEAFTSGNTVGLAVDEIVRLTEDRNSVLIFCCTIDHMQMVVDAFQARHNITCASADGGTVFSDREKVVEDFKAGRTRYLANVGLFTTGFDAPRTDAVALLRSTMSPGLYYQMVGRLLRPHEDKQYGIVLDFGGNAKRHGDISTIHFRLLKAAESEQPQKAMVASSEYEECGACHAIVSKRFTKCPECGAVNEPLQEPSPRGFSHSDRADDPDDVPASKIHEVKNTTYMIHYKGGDPDAPHPPTLKVSHQIGWNQYQSEWVCIEHTGYANDKARRWWARRCEYPFPRTVKEAVIIGVAGAIASPTSIIVAKKGKYPEIIGYELPDRPKCDHETLASVIAVANEGIDGCSDEIEEEDYIDHQRGRYTTKYQGQIIETDIPF